jgi:hypothetical protein
LSIDGRGFFLLLTDKLIKRKRMTEDGRSIIECYTNFFVDIGKPFDLNMKYCNQKDTKIIDINEPFRCEPKKYLAFALYGLRCGISADSKSVESFLDLVYETDGVQGLEIWRVIFESKKSMRKLKQILEKHAKTLWFVSINEICSSAKIDEVVEALCSLKVVRYLYWQGLKCKTTTMENEPLTFSDHWLVRKRVIAFTSSYYNQPHFCNMSISVRGCNLITADAGRRKNAIEILCEAEPRRTLFRNFALAFARTGVQHLALIRIYAFCLLKELLEFNTSPLYDEGVFVEMLIDSHMFFWHKQYLSRVMKFKLERTEYFCRNCQFCLSNVKKPLICKCGRACFCSDVCRRKRLLLYKSLDLEGKLKVHCCAKEERYGFVFCKECLVQEYHICENSKHFEIACNDCYFGPCPRGCGLVFSKHSWALDGKEHNTHTKCFKRGCAAVINYTCWIKDNINSAKKPVVYCHQCRSSCSKDD